MRKLVLLILLYLFSGSARTQTPIPLNSLVNQNFNSMNTGLTLPANWRVSAAGVGATATWATGASSLTQAANSGSPATGGSYNWGTSAGTDRAVGFMSSVSYATPNAIMAHYRNTTGATVTTVTISYSIERYRLNTSSFSLSFFSSGDGTTWTARNAGDISSVVFATAGSAYTFNLPQTTYRSVTISGLSIANNTDIYFRWVFTDGAAATAQGLGLDNVSIFAGTATPVILAQLVDTHILDAGVPGQVNPDDQLRYTSKIKNIGSGDANNVVLTQPAPTNTTLVPGTVRTSSLARDESYTININTLLSPAAPGVLSNDFGLPAPSVATFGPSNNSSANAAGLPGQSDNGGTLTVNANGSFSYTPPAGFTGVDRFSYKASNGNAPDNDAIVTITVGTAPAPVADNYSVVGNVQINPTGSSNILNNDAGSGLVITAVNGSAANVGTMFTTANGSNVTVSANGDVLYNPGPGYEGSENISYTIDNGFGTPQTVNITFTVSGMVWFINAAAPAGGDGRLTNPFNSIAAFNTTAADAANDNIFVYENAGTYDGTFTLLNNQRLIGQDASSSLSVITGLTPNAVYSLQFPVMNATAGQTTTLTTSAAATNTINLGSGNTVRGLTVGATTGSKITGLNFGTLTLGDNTTPDLTLTGAGQALGLTTGAFSATTGLVSITSTSSTAQGINLSGVTGHAGTVNFGSTSIAASTSQGIFVGTTTANINFGNTTVNGGTVGILLQNNSAGTRTFGTLNITTSAGNPSFQHLANGGTSIAGVTTISNATGTGIDIQQNATTVNFGATTITKSGAGTAINIANTTASNGNITFTSVTLGTSVTRLTGPAVVINNTGGTNTSIYDLGSVSIFTNGVTALGATAADGNINISAGTIDATGGSAIAVTGPAGLSTLNFALATVNSNGGTNNISFVNCAGTAIMSAGSLTGTASGPSFSVSGGSINITYSGSITQAQNAALVSVGGAHTGTINFNTGTLSATNGTGLQFDNADGTYNINGTATLNGGDAGIDIINGSNGTFSFSSNTSVTNPAGTAINISTSTAGNITYSGTFNKTSAGNGIVVNAKTGGIVTFDGTGTKTLTTSTGTAINLTNNTGATINFSGSNLLLTTTSGLGFNATGGGSISLTGTGNIISTTTGIGVNIITPTNINASGFTLRSVTVNNGAAASATGGIVLNGTTNSFTVTGDGTLARNGSGGTITRVTDDAISLTNASNVTIQSMNLTTNGGSAPATLAEASGAGGDHTIQVMGGSNIIFSGILIDNPIGSGYVGLDMGGTNRVNNNSLFTNLQNGSRHGMYINNTNVNMTLFEFRNSTMNNSLNDATMFFFANTGTSNMTLDVKGCTFENLDVQALAVAGGGVAATTGTLTSTIGGPLIADRNFFQNAQTFVVAGVTFSAENNLAVLVGNGATHNNTTENNLFSNIAEDGTIANTSIVRTQNSGGKLSTTLRANVIQNISYAASAGGRHVIGHVFEPVAYTAADYTNITIENNSVTNVTYPSLGNNREFIFIDYRPTASNGNVTIRNNSWNMSTAGAQQAMELRFRQTAASTVNVLVQNNTGTHNTAAPLLDIDSEASADVRTTITGNVFTDTDPANGDAIAISSETAATSLLCTNITGNNLTAAGNTISLTRTGVLTCTQASAAAITAANTGSPTVNVTGAVSFGQPACQLPTARISGKRSIWSLDSDSEFGKDYFALVSNSNNTFNNQ